MRVLSVVEKSEHANLRNPDSYRVPGSPEDSQERVFLPSQLHLYVAHLMAKFALGTPTRLYVPLLPAWHGLALGELPTVKDAPVPSSMAARSRFEGSLARAPARDPSTTASWNPAASCAWRARSRKGSPSPLPRSAPPCAAACAQRPRPSPPPRPLRSGHRTAPAGG